MTAVKRRYIDELLDGIRFSGGGPVSISLETTKRLESLWKASVKLSAYDTPTAQEFCVEDVLDTLDEEMPEPKP